MHNDVSARNTQIQKKIKLFQWLYVGILVSILILLVLVLGIKQGAITSSNYFFEWIANPLIAYPTPMFALMLVIFVIGLVTLASYLANRHIKQLEAQLDPTKQEVEVSNG